MNVNATVRLTFESGKKLKSLMDALTPEVKRQVGVRSKVTMVANRHSLVLNVEAEDTVALRAALNTYLRWVNSTLNVLEKIGK